MLNKIKKLILNKIKIDNYIIYYNNLYNYGITITNTSSSN